MSEELFGIVRCLVSFRQTGSNKDYIIVGSDSGRIVILEYEASKNAFKKVGSFLDFFGHFQVIFQFISLLHSYWYKLEGAPRDIWQEWFPKNHPRAVSCCGPQGKIPHDL